MVRLLWVGVGIKIFASGIWPSELWLMPFFCVYIGDLWKGTMGTTFDGYGRIYADCTGFGTLIISKDSVPILFSGDFSVFLLRIGDAISGIIWVIVQHDLDGQSYPSQNL